MIIKFYIYHSLWIKSIKYKKQCLYILYFIFYKIFYNIFYIFISYKDFNKIYKDANKHCNLNSYHSIPQYMIMIILKNKFILNFYWKVNIFDNIL